MSNSHRNPYNHQSSISPKLRGAHLEETIGLANSKTLQHLNVNEIHMTFNTSHPNTPNFRPDTHMTSPKDRNNSFSDIISPQNIQNPVNMSLERELENNVHKSLNTMSDHSNIFQESSIHKDEQQKPSQPSAFDLRENPSLFNNNGLANSAAQNQANKLVCILCHNSWKVQTAILGPNPTKKTETVGEYDLIFPCLCNIRAHRECLKAYLLLKEATSCERCKVGYAACGRTLREISISRDNLGALIFTVVLCLGVLIAGVIMLAGAKDLVRIVGIILMVIGVLGIGYLVWRKYFSKRIMDISVYCKQTEIARHREGSIDIMVKFVRQEKLKRASRVLRKANKLFVLFDLTEYETYLKTSTPRIDRQEKIPNHERNASSHFLLSEPSKPKEAEDEEEAHKQTTKKELFIAPTEIEKSENTAPDHPTNTNTNEQTASRSTPIPTLRPLNRPGKYLESQIQKKLPVINIRPQFQTRRPVGSQSDRGYMEYRKLPQRAHPTQLSTKAPQSVVSAETRGFSARERVQTPDIISKDPPKEEK